MEGWRDGGMEGWRDGGMEGSISQDINDNFLPWSRLPLVGGNGQHAVCHTEGEDEMWIGTILGQQSATLGA